MRKFVYILLLSYSGSFAQSYPKKYFSKPIDPPYKLAGNFGEIRADHFHSGIDFSTSEEEGKNVYAAADGYVSRIKISSVGFGKAVYITHPNGFVTVYAHLKEFYPELEKYVHDKQYEKESFEIELFPTSKEFPVMKGQVIAYSGNTGSSTGPHMHFEIRHEKTEEPINAQLFGYKIPDKAKPEITMMKIIPKTTEGIIAGHDSSASFKVIQRNAGKYFVTDTQHVWGKVGFEFAMTDFQEKDKATIGIYSMQLKVDTAVVYSYKYNRFNFNETRYVNSHIDYAAKVNDGVIYERCFHQGRNPLRFYKDTLGFYNFNENRKYKVKATVKDFNGNTSTVEFFVKGDSSLKIQPRLFSPFITVIAPQYGIVITEPDMVIDIPSNALYDTCYLLYKAEEKEPGFFSPSFIIGDRSVPLHLSMTLSLKATGIPDSLKSKAVIASKTQKQIWISEGGSWSDNLISTRTRHFGTFAVALDTISPLIGIKEMPDTLTSRGQIGVKIIDDFTGIKSYRATIDGKWILLEYDAKNDMLNGRIEIPSTRSSHLFEIEIEVVDETGNKSIARRDFVW
jgi:hypothetical protein